MSHNSRNNGTQLSSSNDPIEEESIGSLGPPGDKSFREGDIFVLEVR